MATVAILIIFGAGFYLFKKESPDPVALYAELLEGKGAGENISAEKRKKLFDKVIEGLEQQSNKSSEDMSLKLQLATAYYSNRYLEKSEKTLKDILAQNPENASLYVSVGNVLQEQGKYQEAVSFYDLAKQKDSHLISAYINLYLVIKNNLNDQARAQKILLEAKVANPGNEELNSL